MLGCVARSSAQGFVVHKTDGTVAIFPSSEVEHVNMVNEEDSYVFGNWYLGFWKYGDNVVHFDGTEFMAFAGITPFL